MRYTPVELRHVRLGRSLFGYKRRDVDSLLEDVADSYEEVWRERGELTDRVEDAREATRRVQGSRTAAYHDARCRGEGRRGLQGRRQARGGADRGRGTR